MPGKAEESGPNPQSCDTACSQSPDWDHQGCRSLSGRSGRSFSGTGGPGGSSWGVSTISVLWMIRFYPKYQLLVVIAR